MRGGIVAATLVAVLALATPATGGEPTDTLRRLFDHANRILLDSDATDDARLGGLRALVRDAFDAREAAALALGRAWTSRTAAERDEFSRLYGDVIESAYLGGVGSRARLHVDGIRVAFESESVQGTTATVVTTLETRGGDAMPIEYRLSRGERGWAVVDVVVEGLSLAASYRAQIQRVMQTGTYGDLLGRLRDRASTATLAALAAAKTAAMIAPRGTPPPPSAPLAAPPTDAPAAPPSPTPAAPTPAAPTPAAPTPHVAVAIPEAARLHEVAAPSAPLASLRKSVWIQVGAFRNTDAASRVVERLRSHSVVVATGGPRSQPLARVLVGPFTNRAAAASTLRELAAGGYPAFIAVE
jgi:phospholipid transport system substrate-binding protein